MKRDRKKNKNKIEQSVSTERDAQIISHLRQMVGMLEDRDVSEEEIRDYYNDMLEEWRQRPLDYWLNKYKIPSDQDGNGNSKHRS